jgi:hypothetical protein
VAGLCLRPETAVVVVALASVFSLKFFRFNIIKTTLFISPFLVCIILFLGVYSYKISNDNSFYYQIEPDVEYEIMDRKNIVPLSYMNTKKDSAKYLAATKWMLGDFRKVNPDFMKSIINKQSKSDLFGLIFNLNQFITNNLLDNIYILLSRNKQQLFFFITVSVLLFYSVSFKTVVFGWLIYLLGFSIMIYSLSINYYDRVIQPLFFTISCLFLFFVHLHAQQVNKPDIKKIYKFIMVLTTTLLILFQFRLNLITANKLTDAETEVENTLSRIFSEHNNRKYVVVIGDFVPFNTGTFKPFVGFNDKTLIMTEMGQQSANPSYLKTIATYTGCRGDDFKCRIQFIENNFKQSILITNTRRIELYKIYMKAMYGFDFDLTKAKRYDLQNDTYVWIP